MGALSTFLGIPRLGLRSGAARILVLCSLLLTSGCTAMVFEAYRGGAMADPIYMWSEDNSQPEIHVFWSRLSPTKTNVFTEFATKRSPTALAIRPDLEGCDTVEVFLNDTASPLQGADMPVQRSAIEFDALLIPDDQFPDCSVLITFRRLESSQGFVLTAATRDGVVAEFPNGKRKLAWLLLMPVAVVTDATGYALSMAALLAVMLVILNS